MNNDIHSNFNTQRRSLRHKVNKQNDDYVYDLDIIDFNGFNHHKST